MSTDGLLLAFDVAPPPGGGLSETLMMLGVIFAIFYFLVIRPQNKQRDEHRKMLAGLKKGDEVVTDGGIVGTVHQVEGDRVEVEVAPKVRMTFLTQSVQVKLDPKES
ncbi:MAG: preprotein translocase subunit YajC [Alphaproteobacteria bacterium]|nr:preprotein translocase subunit YajC [Alphaproteobacteria bacterium]MCB9791654.1 preprotein translocase subunit YajC [Alphaproteobacteria bacterium]